MLIWGTANPIGFGDSSYNGLYLTDSDIDRLVQDGLVGTRVLLEHRGSDVGRVVSAWKHDGKMDMLLELDGKSLDSHFGREFVRAGLCKDLSLGYNVTMSKSESGALQAGNKRILEVSLVRTGARDDCHIHGWSAEG